MLPELFVDPNDPDSRLGSLLYAGHEVSLRITPDEASLEECLSSAVRAVSALAEIDAKAKDVAARELLAEYNEHWRHYIKVAEDGTKEEKSDPELGASDFKARLTMTCFEVLGSDCYDLMYDDDDMFAGHSVTVITFDGLQFSDSHASLFG